VAADLWSVRIRGCLFAEADFSGARLLGSGLRQEETLAQFAGIRFDDKTQWDEPAAKGGLHDATNPEISN
jgi:hypothetical protein